MSEPAFIQHLHAFFSQPPLPGRYADYDMAEARARLLARRGDRVPSPTRGSTAGGMVTDLPEPGPESATPRPRPLHWLDPRKDHPADIEDARRALNAVCVLMVFSPDSGLLLRRLLTSGPVDAQDVLVFACLLHLLGHDGARFWWQLAAGADSDTAVYCLFLEHSRHGEYDDAALWADRLDTHSFTPVRRWGPFIRAHTEHPLPPTLLTYINDYEHPLLGPVPRPTTLLADVLCELVEPPPAPAYLRERSRPLPAPEAPSPEAPQPFAAGLPWLAAPQPPGRPGTPESSALQQARAAETVVRVLEQHPLGAPLKLLGQESGLPEEQLLQQLPMLVEEEFAKPIAGGTIYVPGPALDRLASPGGTGLQLQHTLALARDSVGAAVYLSRYVDGEVHITQMADGPVTPAVNEWVDFRAAAHASAVGKCLLTQLDHDTRTDHFTRHKAARLTRRTITNPRALFERLDRITPDDPVYDLREYSTHTVCSAVPITIGTEAGSLALSLPYASASRLPAATRALSRKAVPVLLTLLLAGAKLPDAGPDPGAPTDPDVHSSVISSAKFEQLRRLFRTPLGAASAIHAAGYSPLPGPHLVTESGSDALYIFATAPAPALTTDSSQLTLPHTYTTGSPTHPYPGQAGLDAEANSLLVFST
ncbi:IclR family transcriptional regulator C-terminal domain-containing protein [Streptomyces sp. NPDC059496]|uniref:IclR family transcriptional regulator domain-containing protein n=1 Tax=Streptomyces sp. NPDC059496 TaxID=3346851 RepID=UPI0036811C66